MIDRIHPFPPTLWSRTLVRTGLVLISVVGASAVGVAGGSALAEGPDSQPGPNPVNTDLIPTLPEIPWTWQPVGPLELRFADPFGPDDKGSTYTDMGGLGESRLTERESALLALSRAAVEASRLAGTLGVGAPVGPRTPTDPATAQRLKAEAAARARVSTPVPGTGGPADHAQLVVDPIGGSPSAPLTAAEAEKLALALAQRGTIVQLPPTGAVVQPEGAPRPPQNGDEPQSEEAPRSDRGPRADDVSKTNGASPAGKGE